jgi:outer membrane protein assembly factor BamB
MRSPILIIVVGVLPAVGGDWPQWRGPGRNGVSAETGWLDGWPAGKAPRVAWRAQVGRGHSTVVVRGGRAYTMGWDGRQDTIFCLDASTGKVVWKQSYPCAGILQWPGPRSTPAAEADAVYTLGQHGQLFAWDAATGKKRWGVTVPEKAMPDGDYGFAWSPLVENGLLILPVLAVSTRDGKTAWSIDARGACPSAVPFVHGDKRGVAVMTVSADRENAFVVGVEPATGKELWRSPPWPEKWGAAGADPLVEGGRVFVTSSEQYHRCARFRIDGAKLVQDWSSNKLKSYTGGCVLLGGHVYGVSTPGLLKCLDWETGAEKWAHRGFDNHGTLTAADGKLIVQASRGGDVVVVEATPAAYRELRRARVFKGNPETFTVPVLAHGRLYCRSYAGEVVCLDLRR